MMKKRIKTYEDLEQEEMRLQAQLESYKTVIAADIDGLKEGLNPIKRVVDIGKKVFTRDDNGPLLNFGLNFGIDLLVKRMLLARAGWIFKFLVPYIVKNYASHIVSEEDRSKITRTIRKWLKKVTKKGSNMEFEPNLS